MFSRWSRRAIQLFLAVALLPIVFAHAEDKPPQAPDTCAGLAGPDAVVYGSLFRSRAAAEHAIALCQAETAASPADMALLAYLARAYGEVEKFSEMRQAIERATSSGNAAAQWVMAGLIAGGVGQNADTAQALIWYRRSAEQGFAAAQFALGTYYRWGGDGIAADIDLAVKWMRLAAEQGHAPALQALIAMYDEGSGVPADPAESFRLLKLWAGLGDVNAQVETGGRLVIGRGVERNDAEALDWFRKAAARGSAKAQTALAYMAAQGLGMERNDDEALRWLRMAADQGYAPAQTELAGLYGDGRGVPQDPAEALRLYRLAADQFDPVAQVNLGDYYARGKGVGQSFAQAAEFYRKAAEAQYGPAMMRLADLYRDGKGVARDPAKAMDLYGQARARGEPAAEAAAKVVLDDLIAAADKGSADAALGLGLLYERGWAVPQNDMLAARYILAAAQAGMAPAQHQLGLLYRDGRGVERNGASAGEWLRRAVAQNYKPAFRDLMDLYISGQGLPGVRSAGEAASAGAHMCLLDETMKGWPAKALPVEVRIDAASDQPTVADRITVSWRVLKDRQAGCETPRYLIVAMPDDVRLDGTGFVALRPGQDGPFGINTDKDRLRVVVPLYFGSKSREGTFRIKLAKAGPFKIGWFLAEVPKSDVASADPSKLLHDATLTIAPADGGRQWDVGFGPPSIYVEDRYSLEKPEQTVTSNDGSYVLRIFKGFFQVHDSRTQRLILEAAGWKPNFSPTSRFLAAYGGVSADADFNVSVFDLATGSPIYQPDKQRIAQYSLKQKVTQIAWFAHDSYVLLAAPSLVGSVLLPTLTDGASFDIPGRCNACGVWDLPFSYDNDLLTFGDGSSGAKYLAFPGLETLIEGSWSGEVDEKKLNDAALYGEVAGHFRLVEQPALVAADAIAWRLGDTFGLSHGVEADAGTGNPLDYVVAHGRPASPAGKVQEANETPAHQRYASRSAMIVSDLTDPQELSSWSDLFQARLSTFGLALAPGAGGQHAETTAQAYEGEEFGARFAESVAAQSALGATIFATAAHAADSAPGCMEVSDYNQALFGDNEALQTEDILPQWWKDWDPAWGDRRIATYPRNVFATWRWDLANEKLWAYQTVCANAGSGQFTQGMLGLLRQGEDGKADAIWLSNLKWQGKRLSDLLALSRPESIVASISRERYLLLGSRNASAFIAVYDLEERKLIAGFDNVRNGYLMQHLELTSDGRSLLQWNEDAQFHLYDLKSFAPFLSGYYLDDEIVLYDSQGYYDATTEGASFVHLSFSGSAESNDLQQFARTLHRPDIIRAALMRQGAEGAAPSLSAPPRLTARIANRQSGTIALNINATSRSGLERIRVYRDGYLLEDMPVKDEEVRRDLQVSLTAEARWLAVKAIDTKGYESATLLIDVRGETNTEAGPAQGRLFALSIGVDQYRDLPGLRYAKSDAVSFSEAVKMNRSAYYRDVAAGTLTNAQATAASIFDAVAEIAREARQTDTILLYFAGHGVRGDDNEFYIALAGTELENLPATALSWTALSGKLRQLPGRVIVFLDACHSGLADQGATNDDYVEALQGRSLAVLAASKGRQYSLESDGGGLFTRSLVDVIAHERDRFDENHNGVLELSELYAGVKSSVVKATGGYQTPWIASNYMVGEVPLF